MTDNDFRYHSSHWGTFSARMRGDELDVRPFDRDPAPSAILENLPSALRHPARLTQPLIRRGWLEDGPRPDGRRGSDSYVAVDWDEALGRAANELKRLGAAPSQPRGGPLPGARVFGGSYGWSSAGRFHHAQSQVHRFLNSVFGGYVASVDTYSSAAGQVILSYVWGNALRMSRDRNLWHEIAEESELVIAFGGLPLRNLQVSPGGSSQHTALKNMRRAIERGCAFVSVSPLADDMADLANVSRLTPRPATDVAMMLGMAFHLHERGLADTGYLEKYTSGYEKFLPYLTGESDGIAKTPEWAETICGVPASEIRNLAEQAAHKRTHITVAYALQRSRYGEEPVWMALVLAAMLGHWNAPGGGFSYSLGSMGGTGKPPLDVPLPSLPQGENRVGDFIPVARITDLLTRPGEAYTYKGETRHYADIRLVYWAGGNPFHHHQNLSVLAQAFTRPDTVIVHDSVSTATTRYADIVFPATLTAEREDIGAAGNDPFLVPMQRLAAPLPGARDDYEIFADLARRLDCEEKFCEGRTSREWQQALYARTQKALEKRKLPAPDFETFMAGEVVDLPVSDAPSRMERFHLDPIANPLETKSGKIEIWSDDVAASGLPPHPAWVEPDEWLGGALAASHPFQLVANQPKGKLHSQLDFGRTSMSGKSNGRDVARLNADDASRLGIGAGDVIRIWNGRGGLLAVAAPDAGVMPSVIQLSTGAWYAPVELPGYGLTCVNGNPNAVTSDAGASGLSQGCTGQLCLVSAEKFAGEPPPPIAHDNMMKRTTKARESAAGPASLAAGADA